MAIALSWKFWKNIQELNWGQGVEVTKTGAEAAKVVFDLAKAINEQKPKAEDLKPYIAQISSLLDVINAPLGQIAGSVIPFAPIAITTLKLIVDATKKEPSLENCVILVSQVAYVESLQAILKEDSQLQQKINQDSAVSETLARQIKKLGEQEFEEREAKRAILYFHESKLAEAFNQVLQQRLQEAGLIEADAKTVTERVARKTNEYMLSALVEIGDKVKQLVEWYRVGGKEQLEKYLSIDDYLEQEIKPKSEENIFDETHITFRDLYVPLQVKELEEKNDVTYQIEEFVKSILAEADKNKSKQVLFIQGEAGRGKSVFCRMFADLVRQNLHPSFTPILIRLRDVRVLENNLTDTLNNYLENVHFIQSDSGWLTDKKTRFLFLLDGFDELLLEGRANGLKEFLEQVEKFQKDSFCHHQFLVTGRPLPLQGIDRYISQTKSLKHVELQPMDDSIRQTWLEKWEAKVGTQEANNFEQFLQACPNEIKNKLAREPLLLYLLGRMHREQRLNVQMFEGAEGIKAKIRIYDESVKWVLEEQRKSDNKDENLRLTELESEDLRQFMTEAALCVVQSGNESAKVAMLESRLKVSNSPAAKLIPQARDNSQENKKLLNNLLTAFYIKAASGDKDGSVEFVHKSFSEFLFAERLIESFVDWTTKISKRNREEDAVSTEVMDREIYDLFGYGNLTWEIVEYLMGLFAESSEFQDVERLCQLFQRLEYFYFRWCDGEFIDAEDANLPQMKKKQLREQLPDRENHLGLRQVDVCTGLNVMILLLQLHRYAQRKDDLKDKITFYPCGKPDSDKFDSVCLLAIIGYSHCLGVDAFRKNLGLFLSDAYLSGADLSRANLSRANLSRANLSRANLSDADLSGANLSRANLSDANLSRANLSRADLSRADLSGANLSRAYLRDADLRDADLRDADLSGADLRDADLSGADLRDAYLSGAYLSGADLRDAYLRDADLSGAYLSLANLRGANLSRADLSGADLSLANLSLANLSLANLRGANLRGANLRGADLSRADLRGANLRGANLEAVVWNSDTKWLNAKGLHEAVNVSPELAQDPAFAAAVSLSQGISLVKEGKVKEAQNAFKQALSFDPSLNDSAAYWNSICWVGSLYGHAQSVIPICEKAVTLDPDNKRYQDSRGLARVLTGDLVGALEDFRAAVDSGELDILEDMKQRRLRWIEALELGNNPLTPEELEELR
ncbi:pentapeptide repeat-containing protein [Scytonema hofmannii FACHB-248]|uniref:Pentapeptide repeat-containing protein n=1 Tax=Scytonema hofmannii FACHB-248 TaxID=1842502 RepID=A0ABR8GUL0_9CYAN|nr:MULTISPECIES: pentapeptide repeat-containing protein [Nostocales]MBD2606636.1 pentapeptide repeat-containing protein [Scytonema hofmannii FACHB-248]